VAFWYPSIRLSRLDWTVLNCYGLSFWVLWLTSLTRSTCHSGFQSQTQWSDQWWYSETVIRVRGQAPLCPSETGPLIFSGPGTRARGVSVGQTSQQTQGATSLVADLLVQYTQLLRHTVCLADNTHSWLNGQKRSGTTRPAKIPLTLCNCTLTCLVK
jgi:hypothetical protein